MDGLCLCAFRYTTAVDFIQQPVQTGSAHADSPVVVVESEILVVIFARWRGNTLCLNLMRLFYRQQDGKRNSPVF